MTTEEQKRLQKLSGIINSKSQLLGAAGELAKMQLEKAQEILGEQGTQKFSANAIEVAKIIAMNLTAHDLVAEKT